MRNKYVVRITTVALLTAVEIVLSRFLGLSTPIVKLSFSFVPLSIIAMLYGPFYSTAAAACADFIGAILFPVGAFFPGYTITAALTGLTYGLFLYKKPKNWLYIVAAVAIVNICWRLGLNSVWVHMTTGKAVAVIMAPRVVKNLIMIPIETVIIGIVREKICPLAERFVV